MKQKTEKSEIEKAKYLKKKLIQLGILFGILIIFIILTRIFSVSQPKEKSGVITLPTPETIPTNQTIEIESNESNSGLFGLGKVNIGGLEIDWVILIILIWGIWKILQSNIRR